MNGNCENVGFVTSWNKYSVLPDIERRVKVISPDNKHKIVEIPELARINVTDELVQWGSFLHISKNKVYIPLLLKITSPAGYPIPDMVDADSVDLWYRKANDRVLLERNIDYRLDEIWGWIELLRVIEGQVFINYRCCMQRVDVLAVCDDEIKLFLGQEDKVTPRWPALPEGWHGIARIYSRFRNRNIVEEDIYTITDKEFSRVVNYRVPVTAANRMPNEKVEILDNHIYTYSERIPVECYIKPSTEHIRLIDEKIKSKDNLTIAYFGDSITDGGDVFPQRDSFTNRLSAYLKSKYSHKNFRFINSAIGGTNSSFGKERFEHDVLTYKPDIVTVMFVLNDAGLQDEPAISNHKYFIDELKKMGSIPVFITPNMNTRAWMPGLDHAVERMVKFCRDENVPIVDTYMIWKDLKRLSIPYETLLSNGINHPDNIAHNIFFNGLRLLFDSG